MLTLIHKLFCKPTPQQMMLDELHDAKCHLLQAQTALDWANAQVNYGRARVVRLESAIAAAERLAQHQADKLSQEAPQVQPEKLHYLTP